MKATNLIDAPSAQILGLDWLVEAVTPVSAYGDRCFAELRPFRAGEEAQARARANAIVAIATDLGDGRLDAVRAIFRQIPDVASTIARASMGDVLDDPDFLELSRFCTALERVDESLSGLAAHLPVANDAVRTVAEALALGNRHDLGFYLTDAYGDELARARERLTHAQAQLDLARGRERERAALELGREAIESEEFIVMRDELQGTPPRGIHVVREAPTYLLCGLEYGDATVAVLASRDAAADAVANAEERARTRLSDIVREHAAALGDAAAAAGRLDVTLAAAHFAQRHACVAAEIVGQPRLAFERARFLPLEIELAREGREFAQLRLDLHDAAVLTGPNMGGKSVTLQTCGFIALCAAFGLPVPAARAQTALFDQIAWIGMGREPEMGGLLSSFAREVLELKAVLDRGTQRLLILGDEFARTTTPHEGRALLIALLARLRERGACGLLATHLAGIAPAAGVRHFAVRGLRGIPRRPPAKDVSEALAALADAMDYSVAEVSGEDERRGDAIALVALLGIDDAFVEAANLALSWTP